MNEECPLCSALGGHRSGCPYASLVESGEDIAYRQAAERLERAAKVAVATLNEFATLNPNTTEAANIQTRPMRCARELHQQICSLRTALADFRKVSK